MSRQLLESADYELIDSLGLPSKPAKAAMAFQEAFDMIGGVYRLAKWADKNPDKFFALYSKLVPSSVEVNEKRDVQVTVSWLSGRRLSYQDVDVLPQGAKGIEVHEVETLNAPVRPTATVLAFPQPGAKVGGDEHPPPCGEDGGPGQ